MFGLLVSIPARPADLRYTISVIPPDGIHVALRVSGATEDSLAVAMPVWLPGYYRRLDLYRNIRNLVVTRNGQPVDTTTPGPGIWKFANVSGDPVTVEYDVPEHDAGFGNRGEETLGQMGVYVDNKSAFVHPGAALVYVEGLEGNPATVALRTPPGWPVATPLERRADGLYEAPDYDTLNDSPIQMGAFRRVDFMTRNKRFEIITTGSSKVSPKALRQVVEPIAAAGLDLFEGWAPFDRYQFHFHFPPKRRWGGPGLEHGASCVIVFDGGADDRKFRRNCWSIIAHEYIHAWNVKALRPEGLLPLDYRNEASIPSLWFSEGVTEYYAKIIGARSGLVTPAEAIADLSGDYAAYLASPGRSTTSLADASRRVWENGASSGGGGTNYYSKGALAGLLLDARIRAATAGERSLDDALRLLMREYAVRKRAFPPEAVPAAIREATGVDISAEYRIAVETAEDLPLAAVLPAAGIVVESRETADPAMGLEFDPRDSELVVRGVTPNSAADEAHIEVGDVLLTIAGEPAAERLKRGLPWGRNREPGDRVEVVVRRGLEKQAIVVKVKATTAVALKPAAGADPVVSRVFESFWRPDRPAVAAPGVSPDA